ncbi:hypothetical protein N7G274_005024 [Stereocaulon virgatum]|uniref:Uncharacterized protein n=1 Tax=Stereocaulon virgatum TaxID=373712 RepID=A0ABR4A9T3_9LECA
MSPTSQCLAILFDVSCSHTEVTVARHVDCLESLNYMREVEAKGSPTPLTDEPPPQDSVPSRCSRPAYIYTPLKKNEDNIRIIELLPATLSEGFKCRVLSQAIRQLYSMVFEPTS